MRTLICATCARLNVTEPLLCIRGHSRRQLVGQCDAWRVPHWTRSRTHSAKRIRGRSMTDTTSLPLDLGLLADRELQARPRRDVGELQEPPPRAAPFHRWKRGSHHAAVNEVEREATTSERARLTSTSSSTVAIIGRMAQTMGGDRRLCVEVGGGPCHPGRTAECCCPGLVDTQDLATKRPMYLS